jgi:hypothetical protein
MSKPSWEDAPVWAQWSAQEESGFWRWYEVKPDMIEWLGLWSSDGMEKDADYYSNPTNWMNSLERRPESM